MSEGSPALAPLVGPNDEAGYRPGEVDWTYELALAKYLHAIGEERSG